MRDKLLQVIKEEEEALSILLSLLEKQYTLIMKKDVFSLETLVEDIKEENRKVAQSEVSRRKVLGNASIKETVEKLNDVELDNAYRSVKKKVQELVTQKETNEFLLRQQMSLNNQLLNILNPRREMKTYNSYGNLSR